HQVAGLRRTSVCPMLDVMRIQPPLSLASGEPAVAVTVVNLAQEPGGDASGASTDTDRSTVPLDDPLQPGVAREPPDRFFGQRNTGVRLGDPRFTTIRDRAEDGRIGVHDEHGSCGTAPFGAHELD